LEPLEPPDTHYLSAAIGWMELGNCKEAKAELAMVSPGLTSHPNVLEVTWAISASEQNWSQALRAAEALVASEPDRASAWLHRAYALRRAPGGGLKAAWDALLPAVDRFPKEATIPYNLACYACQLARLEEARQWLRRALAVGNSGKIKAMAAADSDLEILWKEVKSW
jgi:tetratricopeptide (TPR) repeat protein